MKSALNIIGYYPKNFKRFLTDFPIREQENYVENQAYQAKFKPLFNKILITYSNAS